MRLLKLAYSAIWMHFWSIAIALALIATILGTWFALRHGWAITLILCFLFFICLVYLMIIEWFLKKRWIVDLSSFQWQSAPIAAGAMIMGWTAYITDISEEKNAILLAIGGVFVLFSIVTLADSLHPDRPTEHRDYDDKAPSKRRLLFCQLVLVQGVLAFLLGLGASYIIM